MSTMTTLPPLPAPVGALAAFDAVVAIELPCVSTAEYNSHEICKIFAENLRSRLSAIAAQAQPAPIVSSVLDNVLVLGAYRKVDRFLRNNLDDNDYEEYSSALSVVLDAAVQPVQPTPLTDEEISEHGASSSYYDDVPSLVKVPFAGLVKFVRRIEEAHGISAPVVPTPTQNQGAQS